MGGSPDRRRQRRADVKRIGDTGSAAKRADQCAGRHFERKDPLRSPRSHDHGGKQKDVSRDRR